MRPPAHMLWYSKMAVEAVSERYHFKRRSTLSRLMRLSDAPGRNGGGGITSYVNTQRRKAFTSSYSTLPSLAITARISRACSGELGGL